jgi:hypothetical protein
LLSGTSASPFVQSDGDISSFITFGILPDLEFEHDASDSGSITNVSGNASAFADQTANNVDLTAAASPPLIGSINGNAGLFYDGAADRMIASGLSLPITEGTIILVVTPTLITGTGADLIRFRLSSAVNEMSIRRNTDDLNVFRLAATGSSLNLGLANCLELNETTFIIARVRPSTSGNCTVEAGNGTSNTGTGPTTVTATAENISLGANSNGTNAFAGWIHHDAYISRFVTDTEVDAIADYIRDKWNIT